MMPGHGKSVLVTYQLGRPGGMAVVLVLTGFMVVQRTFVGAGRNLALETTSSVLIILIGLWLFVRSLRGHLHRDGRHQGRFLSIAAGFVPCPLTTCAVQRRRFPVGESPTRPTRSSRKQPERSLR